MRWCAAAAVLLVACGEPSTSVDPNGQPGSPGRPPEASSLSGVPTVFVPSPSSGAPLVAEPRPGVAPVLEVWPDPEVASASATSLGLTSFTANGRVQPHGGPTEWWFEWGPTTAYGSKTATEQLPPRLAAFYRETFDGGTQGWQAGSGPDIVHVSSGGASGGFVRFSEPSQYDYNHEEGIGIIQISHYFYPGLWGYQGLAFGGNDPDLRDAKIRLAVRGTGFVPRGSEVLWWSQIDVWHGKMPLGETPRYSNWAHTDHSLTDALAMGQWRNVEYRLLNDSSHWTYAGTNPALDPELGRSYVYAPLDHVLAHHDIDGIHALAFVDPYTPPEGSIDLDDFEIAYRNHSLLIPSNGGHLVNAPFSFDDPASLTDGWRNGVAKTWRTPRTDSSGPLEIVYEFERPVTIERIQIHQNPTSPSKDVDVYVWNAGAWKGIASARVPDAHPAGPSFAYALISDLSARAEKVKFHVRSGYDGAYWGLGELEVFGRGNVVRTDDDWYHVNADIPSVAAGQTYHYRLVTSRDGKTFTGEDRTYTSPSGGKPEAATRPATRITNGSARLEARLNTFGEAASVFFEYGASPAYGNATASKSIGREVTPRTIFDSLGGLAVGQTIHYRAVVASAKGTTFGEDASFVAR